MDGSEDSTKRQRVTAQILSAWGLVAGEGRGEVPAVGVASWAKKEPVEAGESLKTLPSGEEKNKVVARFAPAVAKMNPEVVIEWAETILNQAGQDVTMIRSLVQ